MKIHEYQAKDLLHAYNIPVSTGKVAHSIEQAKAIISETQSKKIIVKAQIHAGGRGKAGGVKICYTSGEAIEAAKSILGKNIKTHQTGPEGVPAEKILIESGLEIDKELYCAVTLDREKECPVLICSTEGGMEIEEVAQVSPEKIIKEWSHPILGLQNFQARKMAYRLGLVEDVFKQAVKIFLALDRLFRGKDLSLVEINPLIITKDKALVAIDAKINLEDNALIRHPDLAALNDPSQENPLDVEAAKNNINYINLDGNIGCMVNGAGLAMATMDIIMLYGGMPANFLDVGGGASTEMVKTGFEIILRDPKVKGILVNIFGGIMKCDVIANGIIEANRNISLDMPLVVRLEGTNVEAGRKILHESGLPITVSDSMAEGAEKIVKLVNGTRI